MVPGSLERWPAEPSRMAAAQRWSFTPGHDGALDRAQRTRKAALLQLLPQGQRILDALLPPGAQLLAVLCASAQRRTTGWPLREPICTQVLAHGGPNESDLGRNRGDRQPVSVQRHHGVVARQSACAFGLAWTNRRRQPEGPRLSRAGSLHTGGLHTCAQCRGMAMEDTFKGLTAVAR